MPFEVVKNFRIQAEVVYRVDIPNISGLDEKDALAKFTKRVTNDDFLRIEKSTCEEIPFKEDLALEAETIREGKEEKQVDPPSPRRKAAAKKGGGA